MRDITSLRSFKKLNSPPHIIKLQGTQINFSCRNKSSTGSIPPWKQKEYMLRVLLLPAQTVTDLEKAGMVSLKFKKRGWISQILSVLKRQVYINYMLLRENENSPGVPHKFSEGEFQLQVFSCVLYTRICYVWIGINKWHLRITACTWSPKQQKTLRQPSQQCTSEMEIHEGCQKPLKTMSINYWPSALMQLTGENSQADTSVHRCEPPTQIVLKSL